MKRRIRITAATVVALVALGAGQQALAASAPSAPAPNNESGTWACVVVQPTAGVCVDNPFAPIEKKGGVVGIVSDALGIKRPI